MKRYNKLMVPAAVLLSAGILFTGCSSKENPEDVKDDGILVDVMTVQNDTLVLSNQFIGTVMPDQSVYVIPMAQGVVTNTYFEVGDTVKEGDILFEIDDTPAKLQLEQAELSYNNTKAQLDSSWDSANSQITSSVNQLEAQRTATLAQLQGAQTQYFTLKSSVDSGKAALEAMRKQRDSIDTMTADEVFALAKTLLESMASSGTSGSIDLGSLIGGNIDWDSILNGSITPEEKEKLAEKLRPTLKDMLISQIAEVESSMKQAEMSLSTAETSMDAALKSYEIIEQSLYDAVDTDLSDTKKQLDNSLALAKLGVDSAKLTLSYYDVTAPISGTVISKAVAVNGFATSSQAAYVIANDNIMSVQFSVSESVKNTLTIGEEISVERNGKVFTGMLTEIGNAVNQQTGLFQVKGTVYANGTELPSGVSVKLSAATYKAEDAMIIPYDAVYYESDGAYVYVMKDGRAVKTTVTTGIFDDSSVEITSGIQLEDEIITSWSPRLLDGAPVKAAPKKETVN